MFLRYYLGDGGKRIYTLQATSPDGRATITAHPARFSPDDKFAAQRVELKKRFGLIPC